jgi:succinate dehydrogenase / fumarate reductase cytochrome b subunit
MFLFVIGHMIGNLQVFLGAEAINLYGAMLHAWPEALWGVRIVMLTALVLHIVSSLLVRLRAGRGGRQNMR